MSAEPLTTVAGKPLRFPYRVLAACVGLIFTLFALWEVIEMTWFRGADPAVLHVLYLVRGIGGSIVTVSIAAWILYRGHRRALEQRRVHAERMVEAERLATAGRLAAGMAHEIGNPLSGAMECLLLACDEPDAARRHELLDAARDGLERIDRSVARFLRFARPSELQPVDVHADLLLEGAARLVGPTLRRRRVTLRTTPASGVRCVADPDAVTQALINLLLNAAAACDEGGAVTLAARSEAAGGVRFAVADDGRGVDPELGDAIYQPFVTGRPDGTGLGLSVCRAIAQAHGGDLSHRPRPGGGTVFELWLPGTAR